MCANNIIHYFDDLFLIHPGYYLFKAFYGSPQQFRVKLVGLTYENMVVFGNRRFLFVQQKLLKQLFPGPEPGAAANPITSPDSGRYR
jgi:hypothetical protein